MASVESMCEEKLSPKLEQKQNYNIQEKYIEKDKLDKLDKNAAEEGESEKGKKRCCT